MTETGERIRTITEWREKRRPQILEAFRTYVYGRVPVERPNDLYFTVDAVIPDLFSGQAVRKEVSIGFSGPGGEEDPAFLTLPYRLYPGCTGLCPHLPSAAGIHRFTENTSLAGGGDH